MFIWARKNIFCCFPVCKIKYKKNNKIYNINKLENTDKSNLINNINNNNNINNINNINISYLQNISYKETHIFIPQIRFAKVIKVYDGDTITVAGKLPFDNSPIYRFSVRLRSIDSPEIRGESKKECELAIKSRDALHNLIYGKIIELKNNGKEKYGRLLADIYYNDIHINKWMVDNNYAVKYDGGKKIRGYDWD